MLISWPRSARSRPKRNPGKTISSRKFTGRRAVKPSDPLSSFFYSSVAGWLRRSDALGRWRLRAPLVTRGNRTVRPVVHLAIDRHAFRRSGRGRLQSTNAHETDGDDKSVAHFQFLPLFRFLSRYIDRYAA